MTMLPFNTVEDVRRKYPRPWEITTGTWGQVCKKTFGPFIATILFLHNQQVRWRVKELEVRLDKNEEIIKYYTVRGAGRSDTIQNARNHIEEVILTRLISIHERKQLRKQVNDNLG